ncbi:MULTISPECIES: tetrahydromethanopterin S-methyltransferase subunit MtrG [Methanohalophilus]|jgi:tetrahydromethanopterin S-methyltransferase subunit G|uniref:Tetrahydromethanopterin S-methyltransferase subunit G n=1 Tax=Methanohalophilus euhalobius TaxID=51203 RepID=A0A285G4M5_9EURY|nr:MULTISPECIES: tetrahydromethanopterin S-methyltransferase subunit G [Methanohalophilus]KXS44017.1 MAG: tetrahydromethanopterin S-methyltransferase subunit G [Methanohalophilus sp. T328-1]RSD33647.1 MAG: tetrahydromethanopterin S-methyltransferase subunit G [Methanohalophilus sp.]OBZ34675.1 MAG: tetrahydromethanopterin S-methyltransferase subunit G [Methanohalophilus sp. DAL1]OBZ34973.1 MAG: tetrahydromethanopterin S-methyltransferase subunit G [Methanohalophilus sp. DAL1]ODV49710.1 MAG: tet
MADEQANNNIPAVVVDSEDFDEILKKLNDIDEKIEFANSEITQKIGKKVGRDIGILYGAVAGILMFLLYISISPILF